METNGGAYPWIKGDYYAKTQLDTKPTQGDYIVLKDVPTSTYIPAACNYCYFGLDPCNVDLLGPAKAGPYNIFQCEGKELSTTKLCSAFDLCKDIHL